MSVVFPCYILPIESASGWLFFCVVAVNHLGKSPVLWTSHLFLFLNTVRLKSLDIRSLFFLLSLNIYSAYVVHNTSCKTLILYSQFKIIFLCSIGNSFGNVPFNLVFQIVAFLKGK